MSSKINVVGIGLDGVASLSPSVQNLIKQATLLVGSDRHLGYFPTYQGEKLILGDLTQALKDIKNRLSQTENQVKIIILVSGDPLFFGFGRLILEAFSPELLTFYPQLSSVQLAFNRVKVPWQDASIISAHGRSLDELLKALQQGNPKLAILTDNVYTPHAIARLLLSLNLPISYHFWVCENLGGTDERVKEWQLNEVLESKFSALNVVILLRELSEEKNLDLANIPLLGIPDHYFLTYRDRPGLMTKREVRILGLGELELKPNQIIWDIGAGTGSVSIEIARLFPNSQIYAIEKSAAGTNLIEKNSRRFRLNNVISIHGNAPDILHNLPAPHRIFIGGSGGEIVKILGICSWRIQTGGVIVLALATLENLRDVLGWLEAKNNREKSWNYRLLQVQLSRSIPIANLTRFDPLNPVTLVTIYRG